MQLLVCLLTCSQLAQVGGEEYIRGGGPDGPSPICILCLRRPLYLLGSRGVPPLASPAREGRRGKRQGPVARSRALGGCPQSACRWISSRSLTRKKPRRSPGRSRQPGRTHLSSGRSRGTWSRLLGWCRRGFAKRLRRRVRKGPAATAGLTSLTCDAAPCHRAEGGYLQCCRQRVRKGAAAPAGLASLLCEAAP